METKNSTALFLGRLLIFLIGATIFLTEVSRAYRAYASLASSYLPHWFTYHDVFTHSFIALLALGLGIWVLLSRRTANTTKTE